MKWFDQEFWIMLMITAVSTGAVVYSVRAGFKLAREQRVMEDKQLLADIARKRRSELTYELSRALKTMVFEAIFLDGHLRDPERHDVRVTSARALADVNVAFKTAIKSAPLISDEKGLFNAVMHLGEILNDLSIAYTALLSETRKPIESYVNDAKAQSLIFVNFTMKLLEAIIKWEDTGDVVRIEYPDWTPVGMPIFPSVNDKDPASEDAGSQPS